jgi:pimeloyl-ACP methyl ester carboxylesterase
MKFNMPPAEWLLTLVFCAGTLAGCLGSPPQFFDSDGQSLAYRIEGEGPPLILVHGFQGTGPVHWQIPGTAARLAENFQVIILDCRGHGNSDKPRGTAAYGLEMVEDVRRLMDHLEIDSAHLAGYSMGGWISLKFAASYPERVEALAVGGSGYRDFSEKQLGQILNDLVVPVLHPGYDPVAFEACSDAFPQFQLSEEEVAALPAPLLALAGSEDFARTQAERLAEARSDAMVVIIPDNDHNSTLFAAQFQEALEAFFVDALGAGGQ